MRRLRPVLGEHLYVAVAVAVTSSLADLLAARLFSSRNAVVSFIALSACGAVLYVGYQVRPKARLLRAVRIGLRRSEFHVICQPIVDIHTRHCVGVETLLRWVHPTFGAAGPGQFIGELQDTRLLDELTRFVLRGVNHVLIQPPFPQHWHISVNVCTRHLVEDGFIEDVCKSVGMIRKHLVLELTERSCVERMPRTDLVLSHMRQRGVRLSLGGLGTGFNNFDLLTGFRFDYVKVDRIFLAMRDEANIELLKSVAALVHMYGTRVVVEGIETAVEHDVVLRSRIDLAQGYLYGKPMAVDQLRVFTLASIKTLQDDTGAELKVWKMSASQMCRDNSQPARPYPWKARTISTLDGGRVVPRTR